MFLRLCVLILISIPVSAIAGEYLTDKVDSIINWGFWSVLIGSILGGIAATFIKTEVDSSLSHPIVAKLIIGTGLGFFSCMSYMAYYPETIAMKLALPSFVLGCLGAPIMVFLLTWISDPDTFKKASKKLNKKLGIEDEINK